MKVEEINRSILTAVKLEHSDFTDMGGEEDGIYFEVGEDTLSEVRLECDINFTLVQLANGDVAPVPDVFLGYLEHNGDWELFEESIE